MSMLAYVIPSPDERPALVECPLPAVGPEDVLVRIVASSVNPHDAHVISGAARAWFEYRYPVTVGTDLCGVVEVVGAGVSRFAPGDRVFGLIREPVVQRGGFAEYVSFPADRFVVAVPPSLQDVDAGALPLAAVTALACVDAVELAPGASLLVNGATGGVGSCAVQIAAAAGARVVATGRPGPEHEHVARLGAVEVLDWSAGDLAGQLRTILPGGVDCVIDLVNHDPARFAALLAEIMRPGGRAASTLSAGSGQARGVANVIADASIERLGRVAQLAAVGALVAPVSQTFALRDVELALAALEGGALGKIALAIGP